MGKKRGYQNTRFVSKTQRQKMQSELKKKTENRGLYKPSRFADREKVRLTRAQENGDGPIDDREVVREGDNYILAPVKRRDRAEPCEDHRAVLPKDGLLYCPTSYRNYAKNWVTMSNTMLANLQSDVEKLECVSSTRQRSGKSLYVENIESTTEKAETKAILKYLSPHERVRYLSKRATIKAMIEFVNTAADEHPQALRAVMKFYQMQNMPVEFFNFQYQYVLSHLEDLYRAVKKAHQDQEVVLKIRLLLAAYDAVKGMCLGFAQGKKEITNKQIKKYLFEWAKQNEIVRCFSEMPVHRFFMDESQVVGHEGNESKYVKEALLRHLEAVCKALTDVATTISEQNAKLAKSARAKK